MPISQRLRQQGENEVWRSETSDENAIESGKKKKDLLETMQHRSGMGVVPHFCITFPSQTLQESQIIISLVICVCIRTATNSTGKVSHSNLSLCTAGQMTAAVLRVQLPEIAVELCAMDFTILQC